MMYSAYLGSAEKVFRGGRVWGVGCGVWGSGKKIIFCPISILECMLLEDPHGKLIQQEVLMILKLRFIKMLQMH